ncbi:Bug family tripartite tricarboxylate transporter substrate binding protein [Ramlibacter albus]|uniref:Tripartite tricarboxylate transporter substrate binding protein n=1 Tax=Ramlibacter albus TaxID=2079448 RepID=A0A923MF64_9BURK|nr:tripartite tricarboxylate transporter substrate binding protein [Ramlibacter albus]MBC5767882.1 tripartite tricarboxylate transporter substrate binding protein [Ramlibacter albus]
MINRRTAIAAAGAALAAPSFAQAAYPSRPIRIVVPAGAGGSGDITARLFGKYLEDSWKANVVVENKAGANGLIATEYLWKQPNDGYTLGIASGSTHAAAPYLFKKLPYDPLKDFEHIGLFGVLGSALLVPANSPIQSLKDLVAYSKANPGKVFFGHFNTSSQVPGEMLKAVGQLPIEGVAYKTIANAITDLIGGQIQLMFVDYVAAASHIESGKVRPIAVSEAKRNPRLPNVPAVAELYPGYEIMAFLALYAPAGTPAPVVTKVNRAMRDALATPAIRTRLETLGLTLRDYSPDDYRSFLAREIENWANYAKVAKIEPQ